MDARGQCTNGLTQSQVDAHAHREVPASIKIKHKVSLLDNGIFRCSAVMWIVRLEVPLLYHQRPDAL
jgi:hypothetical protein